MSRELNYKDLAGAVQFVPKFIGGLSFIVKGDGLYRRHPREDDVWMEVRMRDALLELRMTRAPESVIDAFKYWGASYRKLAKMLAETGEFQMKKIRRVASMGRNAVSVDRQIVTTSRFLNVIQYIEGIEGLSDSEYGKLLRECERAVDKAADKVEEALTKMGIAYTRRRTKIEKSARYVDAGFIFDRALTPAQRRRVMSKVWQYAMILKKASRGTARDAVARELVAVARMLTAGVADTIAKQMGGLGRLRAMLGAHSFATNGSDFSFVFPNKQRSKGNSVKITLGGDDLYTMEFFNVSVKGAKRVARFDGLFFDQLIETFERQTGWALRL